MPAGELTKEAVEQALDGFKDPETGRSVVVLGQVHDLEVEDRRISLTLGLTTFSAPLWHETQGEVVDFLRAKFSGLSDVTVHLAVHERPAQKIGQMGLAAKSVIAIGSGKGGVGKSTIAAILAYGLSKAGSKVGLLDADVYGPSIPQLIGATEQPHVADNRIQPIQVDGVKVMSMGLLTPPGEAVLWRGPMLHGALTQFLRDTEWGDMDYLIIDMPPGTGDVPLSLSQLLPAAGAVVVCTPQDVALLDATRAIAMFRRVSLDVLGMVENMSHFICPDCGSRHDIFGSGGARKRAAELSVPFLGEVPLTTRLRILGDEGKVASSFDDQSASPYLESLAGNLVRNLVARRRRQPPMPSLSVLG